MGLYINLILLAGFWACKDTGMDVPCSEDPCAEDACAPQDCEPSGDSTFMGLDTLWATSTNVISGRVDKIDQSDTNIFLSIWRAQSYEIYCFRKDDGRLQWTYNEPIVDYFSDIHYDDISNRLILQRWNTVVALDAEDGTKILQTEVFENNNRSGGGTYGKLLDGYYYIPMDTNNRTVGGAVRSKTTDLQNWEWAYRITQSEVDGIEPSTDSYNLWIHPETGDEILLLQHRMAFWQKRIDLVAYNMTADSMYWWHKDIEPAGNSNIGQIAIVDGRAIFQGADILHCYDIKTGALQWRIDGRPDRGYMTAFSNIVNLKNGNIIATVRDVSDPSTTSEYITQKINLENGNILRELHIHTGYVNRVYKNGYLFGSGRERIVNINSGWSYWSEVDNNNLGIYDILVDEERQLYYGIYGGIVQDDARLMAWDISGFLD